MSVMRLFSAPTSLVALLAAAALSGCATGGMRFPGPLGSLGREPVPREVVHRADDAVNPDAVDHSPTRRSGRAGAAVASSAAAFIGRSRLIVDGDSYRFDCSGMVCAAYARAGIPLSGSSEDLYELARARGVLHKHKRPAPGDVAFFDDTYDRNGNGRRDDPLSHVAVVESIDAAGTVTLVHKGGSGVVRIRMNLAHPDDHRSEDGEVLNDYLRSGREDGGPRTTGGLFRAFGSFWAMDANNPA